MTNPKSIRRAWGDKSQYMHEVEYDTTVKNNKDTYIWTWKIPRSVNGGGVDSMHIMHRFAVKRWKLEPIFACLYAHKKLRRALPLGIEMGK